jgi:hypothetical protein
VYEGRGGGEGRCGYMRPEHGRYMTVTPERALVSVSVKEWHLHTAVIN